MAPAVMAVRRRDSELRSWGRPLLAALGAGAFLYGGSFPLIGSPRVCCPRLIVFSGLDLLSQLLPLAVPVAALLAGVGSGLRTTRRASLSRGVLFSAGLVGIALISHAAGGLIHVKGGRPALGAILGVIGAALILVSSLLGERNRDVEEESRRPAGPLRLVGPISILLGAGLFTVALLLPWTTRPFPIWLVHLSTGPYWIWSIVVPSAIVLPVSVAAARMLPRLSERQTEVGIALAGGLFATLLFVRVVGRVLSSAPPPFPPVFSLEIGAYMGLAAGSLIMIGAAFHAFMLRLDRRETQLLRSS